MSVSVGSLQAAFTPEFDNIDSGLISSCISDAVSRISTYNWGYKSDVAIQYLAAHLLSIRASGQNARLVSDLNSTIYGKEYLAMVKAGMGGPRVAGFGYGGSSIYSGSSWGYYYGNNPYFGYDHDMRPFGWIAS